MLISRIVWVILFILSLVGITMYGGPISYGFFALMIMVPFISVIYLLCVYFCFKIYQSKDVVRPVVGEAVPFHFRLMDEFFFAFAGIRVKFFTSFSSIEGLDDEAEYELIPGHGVNLDTKLVCKYRGNYEVGIKTVEVQDFFRLFRFSYHNPETMRVDVMPQVVRLDGIKSLDQVSVLQNNNNQNVFPDVLVREYMSGDDIRQINWKVSSHVGKLMVRKQIDEEKQGIGIIIDSRRYSDDQKDYLPIENKMLEAAIAISLYFVDKQTPVATFVGSEDVRRVNVNRLQDFDDYYEAISNVNFSKLQPGGKNMFDSLMNESGLYECKMVFFITKKLSDDVTGLCKTLRTNNVYVQICLINNDDDEESLYIQNNQENLIHMNGESDLAEVL